MIPKNYSTRLILAPLAPAMSSQDTLNADAAARACATIALDLSGRGVLALGAKIREPDNRGQSLGDEKECGAGGYA